MQVPSEHFLGMFSSLAKFTTLHMLLALIAHLNLKFHQFDIMGAYLQGLLDEEIYTTSHKRMSHAHVMVKTSN